MAGGKCSKLLPLIDSGLNVLLGLIYMFKSMNMVYVWYQSLYASVLLNRFHSVLKFFKFLGYSVLTPLIKNKIINVLETTYRIFLVRYTSFSTSKFV